MQRHLVGRQIGCMWLLERFYDFYSVTRDEGALGISVAAYGYSLLNPQSPYYKNLTALLTDCGGICS
jgi:hypothetical protein